MDGMCRTDRDALTTQTALRMVDVREVVCDGDGFKLTLFKAERATYAGITTCLFRYPSFILIATADEDASTLRSFLAELDERLGAGLNASATSDTFVFEDERKTGLRIHRHRIEVTGPDAVAESYTAPGAVGISLVEGRGYSAASCSIIDVGSWASFARPVTAEYSDQWVLLLCY